MSILGCFWLGFYLQHFEKTCVCVTQQATNSTFGAGALRVTCLVSSNPWLAAFAGVCSWGTSPNSSARLASWRQAPRTTPPLAEVSKRPKG